MYYHDLAVASMAKKAACAAAPCRQRLAISVQNDFVAAARLAASGTQRQALCAEPCLSWFIEKQRQSRATLPALLQILSGTLSVMLLQLPNDSHDLDSHLPLVPSALDATAAMRRD